MVKEVRLALQQGYKVEVVCFEFDNWSYDFNRQIKETFKEATLHVIPAGRKPFLPWAVSVFLETFFRIAGNVIPLKGWWLSQAVTRRTILLTRKVKKISGRFDLVIGHNPGALYPVYIAGKKFGSRTGFDVEDYHPGETNDKTTANRTKKLLQLLLPKMNFITFASIPIREEIKTIACVDGKVIMNWFSEQEFNIPDGKTGKIRLVWFSQNISFNRGLERVIPVIETIDEMELHLFGNCNTAFQRKYLSNLKNVVLHSALPQTELHKKLREFDCGLAIEPKKDLNNDLAVSNKILAYFQAGLYIIASDTTGQKYFLDTHSGHGLIINLHSGLQAAMEAMLLKKEEIRMGAQERFRNAARYNWESESEKLLRIWKGLSC